LKTVKIKKLTLTNFRFFLEDNNSFKFDSENILIYGENGSGKSSIFKAFELLAKISKDDIEKEFKESKNIFNLDKDSSIEFEFDNEDILDINDDHLENDLSFIDNFYLVNPLLDYKKLLYVNFTTNLEYEKINLFPMLSKIFENYPIDIKKDILLKDIENPSDRLESLKTIINTLFDDINLFLEKFTSEFKIEQFDYTTGYIPLAKNLGLNNVLEFIINIEINFKNRTITKHHEFLNEARLSALAISIYFAIIKHLSSLSKDESLKILVLDDLLISLDMSNRLSLIPILKENFKDFQIIFLTHDRELFEVFKDRLNWKGFEIYVDENNDYEKPILKTSNSYIDKATIHFRDKNYDCCANLLRKSTEGLLNKLLPKEKRFSKTCEKLQLNDLLQNAINYVENNEDKELIKNIQSFTKTIFNPQSHNDNRAIYKSELQSAIKSLKELRDRVENETIE